MDLRGVTMDALSQRREEGLQNAAITPMYLNGSIRFSALY